MKKLLTKYLFLNHFLVYCAWVFIIDLIYKLLEGKLLEIFETCVVSPVWEEVVYRYAPIEISKILNKELVFPVCLATSLLFGFYHAEEVYNVLIQGVFGIFCCSLYLRKGLLQTILFHSTWNALCLLIE